MTTEDESSNDEEYGPAIPLPVDVTGKVDIADEQGGEKVGQFGEVRDTTREICDVDGIDEHDDHNGGDGDHGGESDGRVGDDASRLDARLDNGGAEGKEAGEELGFRAVVPHVNDGSEVHRNGGGRIRKDISDTSARGPTKRPRREVDLERMQLDELPSARLYERSFMHQSVVTHVVSANRPGFIITASCDGVVKFWKKTETGIEFVKRFNAHLGPVTSLVLSSDDFMVASLSKSVKSVCVFDVIAFDLIRSFSLEFVPSIFQWVHGRDSPRQLLAIAHDDAPQVDLFRVLEDALVWKSFSSIHEHPLSLMIYNEVYDTIVSTDTKGFIEYWSTEAEALHPEVKFKFKIETDLFEFVAAGTRPISLDVSPDGKHFACLSLDRHLRIFNFLTGKMETKINLTLDELKKSQEEGQVRGLPESDSLDPGDYGRRVAREKVLDTLIEQQAETLSRPNAIFDTSGRFVLFATMFGIQILSLHTNQIVRALGAGESAERFMRLAIFQPGATVRERSSVSPYVVSYGSKMLLIILICRFSRLICI